MALHHARQQGLAREIDHAIVGQCLDGRCPNRADLVALDNDACALRQDLGSVEDPSVLENNATHAIPLLKTAEVYHVRKGVCAPRERSLAAIEIDCDRPATASIGRLGRPRGASLPTPCVRAHPLTALAR
jgi:hypothetical protein